MSDRKCPFCGEPAIRTRESGTSFRCGTLGPDINGEYSTGHICDIATYNRLLADKQVEIERLTAENAAADIGLAKQAMQIDEQQGEIARLSAENTALHATVARLTRGGAHCENERQGSCRGFKATEATDH